jgi:hypothetical protein
MAVVITQVIVSSDAIDSTQCACSKACVLQRGAAESLVKHNSSSNCIYHKTGGGNARVRRGVIQGVALSNVPEG